MTDKEQLLAAEWEDAERTIKLAEVISSTTIVPAINELRFAGRRAVEALDTEESARRAHLYEEAIAFCRSASGDAIDAATIYLQGYLRTVRSQVGAWDNPALVELTKVLHDLEAEAIRLRTDNGPREYDRSRFLLSNAVEIYRNIDLSLSEFSAKNTEEKRHRGLWLLSLAAGILGVLVSAASTIIPKLASLLGLLR